MVKKLFATMVTICACALSLASPSAACAVPGAGGPTVVYDGAQKAWYGENLQEQDVAAVARDVMPGDTIIQEFGLAVRRVERGATLSMRPSADAAALAALGDMSVEVADGSGAIIAHGTLAELAAEGGTPIPLGAYDSSAMTTLHITLTVPTSVGNESLGAEHAIAWVFTAQEDGGSVSAGSDDLLVQTGDNLLNVYGPFALSVLGLLLIAAAMVAKHRR